MPEAAAPPVAPLIDVGINLTHDSYDDDRDAVLRRARAAGIVQMVVTGGTLADSVQAIQLAAAHAGLLYATAGVHPHHAGELTAAALPDLERAAGAEHVVAVGECGLDYFRDFSPRPVQRAAFASQLELAVRLAKPVFLHQRDAHADFLAILQEHRRGLVGGVAHCFTGGAAELEAYLALGLHVGITGWICDERRGRHLHELVARIPADRLLLETDGPYLLPRDLRPHPRTRRNEPCYLAHIARTVAAARGEPAARLARSSTQAARALFGLAESASAGPSGSTDLIRNIV